MKADFETEGPTGRIAWRRVRRWRVATTLVVVLAWVVGVIVTVLGDGGLPSLDDRLHRSSSPRPRRPGVYPAWLVLRPTTGWPGDRQIDLTRSFAARWRGPGAMAAGIAWVGHGSLVWAPKPIWEELGGRGFELRLDRTERIELTFMSRRSAGLIIRQSDGAEVWLYLRSKDASQLHASLTRARSLP